MVLVFLAKLQVLRQTRGGCRRSQPASRRCSRHSPSHRPTEDSCGGPTEGPRPSSLPSPRGRSAPCRCYGRRPLGPRRSASMCASQDPRRRRPSSCPARDKHKPPQEVQYVLLEKVRLGGKPQSRPMCGRSKPLQDLRARCSPFHHNRSLIVCRTPWTPCSLDLSRPVLGCGRRCS